MAQVVGTVEMYRNPDQYGKVSLKVGGKFYNTKPEWWKGPEPSVGDQVEFDDGGRNYIKNLRIVGSGGSTGAAAPPSSKPAGSAGGRTFPVGALAPERTINRQNALTNAVAYYKDQPTVTPAMIVDTARFFEAYTCGDLDKYEAEQAALEEMNMMNQMS